MGRTALAAGLSIALAAAGCRGGKRADVGSIEMVHRVQQQALASTVALDLTRQLAEGVGPRLSGSPGQAKAIEWALAAMTTAGLANVHTEQVEHVPWWERGEASASIVSGATLRVAALGGSVGTPPGGIEAEVVEASSLEGVDALGDRARGRIVFVDVKMARTRDASGYGPAVAVRGQAAVHAAKVGALAVVIRSIGTDSGPHPHAGAMRYEADGPKIPAAALAQQGADTLHAALASGPVRMRLELGCRSLGETTAANVVGEVRGKEWPDEIVLLAAHLDSWDLGPGAVDDAAGCGAVIDAARLLAAMPVAPKRTVRVVLFANEENGLAGARAYAEAHAKELGRHVLAIESDLGAGRPYEIAFRAGPEAAPIVQAIERTVFALGIEPGAGEVHGGADVSPLAAAGVPLAELRQDATRYFDVHHSAADTMEAVDADGLAHQAAGLMSVAFGAAEMRGDLGRIPADRRAVH